MIESSSSVIFIFVRLSWRDWLFHLLIKLVDFPSFILLLLRIDFGTAFFILFLLKNDFGTASFILFLLRNEFGTALVEDYFQ